VPQAKSEQLQIRVSSAQKAALKRLAKRAGQDVSAYVLSRALPSAALRFEALLRALGDEERRRFVLAELNDLLADAAPAEFDETVRGADLRPLSPLLRNYVAAMVELAAHQKRVAPPDWVHEVPPLTEPHFATPLQRLREHLLLRSPVPFKRRNLFVDASVGDRV
jgi:uncharacterized protein (DUF1778 family)